MKSPIHSKKHIVQISQATVAQAAILVSDIAVAAEATSTTPTGVEEGCLVKSMYVEYWIQNDSASVVGSYTLIVFKNPGSGHTPAAGTLAALHDYQNKKNILFTAQALAPTNDSAMIPVVRQWFKIPRGKQRMGLADKLSVALRNNNSTALDINICGLAIYKEYT